jgi:23S rRNA G2445 N2-methylase RlmL
MAFAAVPKNDDVVLDPTCGSGTLLAEFHAYAPSARLIGRDIDPQAVAIAKTNVPSADISVGDSRQMDERNDGPRADVKEISLTIANLPFGVQFGDRASNPDLYRDLLKASLHIASAGWRGVFLTSDTDAFAQAVRAVPVTAAEVMFKVKIRGELATCYRVKRP